MVQSAETKDTAGLMPDLPQKGEDALKAAGEALDKESLPMSVCAEMFRRAAELLSAENAGAELIGSAYNGLGLCRYKNGDDAQLEAEAFEKAQSALRKLPDYSTNRLMAVVRCNLAECRVRTGCVSEAAELYRKASAAFERLSAGGDSESTEQYAFCQNSLAGIYRTQGEEKQALLCLNRTISLLNKMNVAGGKYSVQLMCCYNVRGTLRFRLGDYQGEVDDCTRALELWKRRPEDYIGASVIYANRGEAYEAMEKYREMIADMRRSVDCIQLADTPPDTAISVATANRAFAIGRGYSGLGQLEKAAKYFSYSANILSDIEERSVDGVSLDEKEALCRFRRASCLCGCEKHLYYDAMTEFNLAAGLLERSGDHGANAEQLMMIYSARGELYEAFGEIESAREDFRRANELTSRILPGLRQELIQTPAQGTD